jgi:Xaa-Pro aminopeptidase
MVDIAAREYIKRYCFETCHISEKVCTGDCFIHTTGHGIGCKVHQLPRISLKSRARLEKGMIITVEPGIYIKGWGGVRIEDMVLVTKTGHRVLT